MKKYLAWVLVFASIALFIAAAYLSLLLVRSVVLDTVSPIQQAQQVIATQVAEVLHPTPTVIPDPVTIIHEVRSLARLETIQYSVEKVITAETNQGLFKELFGDRLLFVAHGVVIAGLDLSKIEPEDLILQGTVLTVQLPAAEVFITTLDNHKSYVYDRQTGLLTHGDIQLETTARQAAENEILKAAREDGILTLAQQNGENYLERLLRELGYAEVLFKVK
jgi:Protein of unknown function (DUF4230)